MRYLLFIVLLYSPIAAAQDCVVLLHGLGRTSHAMDNLARDLKAEGYLVVNESYPSRAKPIAELTRAVGDGITQCRAQSAPSIHFVTHSLGGILVRAYFQDHVVPEAHRVVMLGPPNHGSEVVDRHGDAWWFKLFTGPAGQELGTSSESLPNRLAPIPLEVGVIAGTKSLDPWFSAALPRPNDGKVSVWSARLAEMQDFITVPHSHTFIADAEGVSMQIQHFLAHGAFEHAP